MTEIHHGSRYAELHCLSNFSFLRGASHPDELIARAAALNYRALAITDECSVSGVVRAHEAARDTPIKLIIGSEFQLADGPKIILLATALSGYSNLSELITVARRAAKKGSYRFKQSEFRKRYRRLFSAVHSRSRATSPRNSNGSTKFS